MGKRYWNSDDTLDNGIDDQTAFDRVLRRRNRLATEKRAPGRPPKREPKAVVEITATEATPLPCYWPNCDCKQAVNCKSKRRDTNGK